MLIRLTAALLNSDRYPVIHRGTMKVATLIIATILVVGTHASEWQDQDVNTNKCYDNERRVCLTCDKQYAFANYEACKTGGKREVCEIGPASICWEQFKDGVYEAGCKLPSECTAGEAGGVVTKCGEGIVKPCGFDNWQSIPKYNFCPGEYTVCEWKRYMFKWTCDPGQTRRVKALWGRMAGDNVTCTEGVPGQNPVDADCPGDAAKTMEGLNYQCDGKVDADGKCNIKAAIKKLKIFDAAQNKHVKYDPCPGVFKYLKVCVDCIDPKTPVLVMLDVSGSLASSTQSYLPLVTEFLQRFFDATSTDAFFAQVKTDLFVVPFDTGIIADEEWNLDYSSSASAADLRVAENNGLADFISKIESKAPTSLTNIGNSLKGAFEKYNPDGKWLVVIVSDFINMQPNPSIASQLSRYTNSGARVHPVLLNKPLRNEQTFDGIKAGSIDQSGIDTKDQYGSADITAMYGLE